MAEVMKQARYSGVVQLGAEELILSRFLEQGDKHR